MARYDENGFDQNGRHRNGTFYDDNGWDAWGFDDYGRHYNGTFYDDRGYDAEGFDRRGRHYATGTFVDENGYDACGRHFKFEGELGVLDLRHGRGRELDRRPAGDRDGHHPRDEDPDTQHDQARGPGTSPVGDGPLPREGEQGGHSRR